MAARGRSALAARSNFMAWFMSMVPGRSLIPAGTIFSTVGCMRMVAILPSVRLRPEPL
jgi:hypothetical protein